MQALPEWIQPHSKYTKEGKALLEKQYEIAFPSVMHAMARGATFTRAVLDLPYGFEVYEFRRWIKKNQERLLEYHEAESDLAEYVFDQLVEATSKLANGEMTDVEAMKVYQTGAKIVLPVLNRKKFGESKQVDINIGPSATLALRDAQKRLAGLVIEAEVEEIVEGEVKALTAPTEEDTSGEDEG